MARSERFAIFSSSRDLPKKSKALYVHESSQRREMLLFLATNMAAERHVQTPIFLLPFSLPSPSSLLKLSYIVQRQLTRIKIFQGSHLSFSLFQTPHLLSLICNLDVLFFMKKTVNKIRSSICASLFVGHCFVERSKSMSIPSNTAVGI